MIRLKASSKDPGAYSEIGASYGVLVVVVSVQCTLAEGRMVVLRDIRCAECSDRCASGSLHVSHASIALRWRDGRGHGRQRGVVAGGVTAQSACPRSAVYRHESPLYTHVVEPDSAAMRFGDCPTFVGRGFCLNHISSVSQR